MLKKISRAMLFSWALVSSVFDASAGKLYTKVLLDHQSVTALEAKLSSVMTSVSNNLQDKTIHFKDYWHMSLLTIDVIPSEKDLICSKQDNLMKYGIEFSSSDNSFKAPIKKSGPKAPGQRTQDNFLRDLNEAYKCRTTDLGKTASEILSKIQNLTFKINGSQIFTGSRGDEHVVLELVPDLSAIADLGLRNEIESLILDQHPHITLAKYSMKSANSGMDGGVLKAKLNADRNAFKAALDSQDFDDIDLSFDCIHVGARDGSSFVKAEVNTLGAVAVTVF